VKAFDRLHSYLVDLAKYLIEQTGMPACIIIDSLASPTFTSPAWFQQFCAPYNRRLLQDVPAMWTISGGGQGKTDFTPLLETYAEMGYGSFMFGPPTDLAKMKQISNEKGTVIMHWALTQEMLRWYTPKQIEERVKECLKVGAPGGKYIMSTDVPDDETPLVNYLAVKEAIMKYGKYPLRFD
jgi:uroporphyrinogen-III decarboxylase